MSLLNRLEDAWKILNNITAEVTPRRGPLGRSGSPGSPADPRTHAEKILDDIKEAADYIRQNLKP